MKPLIERLAEELAWWINWAHDAESVPRRSFESARRDGVALLGGMGKPVAAGEFHQALVSIAERLEKLAVDVHGEFCSGPLAGCPRGCGEDLELAALARARAAELR